MGPTEKGLKGTSYWHLSVLIHCWKRMEIHQKGPIFMVFDMFLTCFWHVFEIESVLNDGSRWKKDLFRHILKGSQRDLFLTPIRINTLVKKDGNSSKRTYFHGFWHVFDCFWHVFEIESVLNDGSRWKRTYFDIYIEKGLKGPLTDTYPGW